MTSGGEFEITPQTVLRAYSIGLFPMAERADDPRLFWIDPERRGVFPLDGLIVSRSLAKTVRSDRFALTVDGDFDAVIAACADRGAGETWINPRIRALYRALFDMGAVHTVEARRDGELVGGLYGVSIGGAFFGESMFHRAADASKVALVHLVARLRRGGWRLLDAQFVTPHLASLGAVEIARAAYRARLAAALTVEPDQAVWARDLGMSGAEALAALA
ncbi:MAG: leucyl/phenylalanyl-tRNA--protein transferase [Methylobacteriaceae bacterium]|nr:leucyl/phenylalanyl-tRNA--protein transferase [Methylobacteriaceae bacterium]